MYFGFRERTGRENAIVYLSNLVYSLLDRSKLCLGIFLDVGKAFDSITHKLLLYKLEQITGKKTFLNWFKHYLCPL